MTRSTKVFSFLPGVLFVLGIYLQLSRQETVLSGVCFLCAGLLQVVADRHFTAGILFGLFTILLGLPIRITHGIAYWVVGGILSVVVLDEFRQFAKLFFPFAPAGKERRACFRRETDISVRVWKYLTAGGGRSRGGRGGTEHARPAHGPRQ